jgi:UDP-N-acetylglucosamine:LPS N-acetylglucosamine transferase
LKEIVIAIACEMAPGKTFIPIIKRLKELENEGKLKWDNSKIIALTHGSGVEELIKPYCDEMHHIGEGRGAGKVKANKIKSGYLIIQDIYKAISGLSRKGVDVLITCGNAGDVRKSIIAAKLLKIPIIHIEQDFYNPIEVIAYSNIITTPEEKYLDFLKENYSIGIEGEESIQNIHGYPMASYVNDFINSGNLISKEEIMEKYGVSDFILVFLGGDLRLMDLKDLIIAIEKANYPTLIVPYRFEKELIKEFVNSSKLKVISGSINLLSLMKSAKLMIYGAGMGMTIEAGVLELPSIKISGFHKKHGSVDLASGLNIPILEIKEISDFLTDFDKTNGAVNIDKPNGEKLLKNSQIAIEKVVDIINSFDFKNPPKSSGFKSMKIIWNQMSKYR